MALTLGLTGGDVNVTDHDGDTPLYAVENIQTARFLIDNGASLQIINNEGISVSGFPLALLLP